MENIKIGTQTKNNVNISVHSKLIQEILNIAEKLTKEEVEQLISSCDALPLLQPGP